MKRKKYVRIFFLILSLNCFAIPLSVAASVDYPNVADNYLMPGDMRLQIMPFLLPLDHPMKAKLDAIFLRSRAVESERTLVDAGFEVIAGPMPNSYIMVVRHPEVPGYVFKLYLDSEKRIRKNIPHWVWLARRCAGARKIKKVIQAKKIKYFSVPDKWLYALPVYPFSSSSDPELVILMATDMELESLETTEQVWKNGIERKHLKELHAILKERYGGNSIVNLSANVPYCKNGKFAFTDTEDLRGHIRWDYVNKYLSKEMSHYWDTLTHK